MKIFFLGVQTGDLEQQQNILTLHNAQNLKCPHSIKRGHLSHCRYPAVRSFNNMNFNLAHILKGEKQEKVLHELRCAIKIIDRAPNDLSDDVRQACRQKSDNCVVPASRALCRLVGLLFHGILSGGRCSSATGLGNPSKNQGATALQCIAELFTRPQFDVMALYVGRFRACRIP